MIDLFGTRNRKGWHNYMEEYCVNIGSSIGFDARKEYSSPISPLVKADCVWMLKEPWKHIMVAFEFESGNVSLHNIAKYNSLSIGRPWIIIQVCKKEVGGKMKEKRIRAYEEFAKIFPSAIKIVHGVGGDPPEAFCKVTAVLFSTVKRFFKLSQGFLEKYINYVRENCEKWVTIHRILRIGEKTEQHLEYLDKIINYDILSDSNTINDYIIKPRDKVSITFIDRYAENEIDKIASDSIPKKLDRYDALFLSDISIEKRKELYDLAEAFLNEYVKTYGKTLVITGGYGLTKTYNKLLSRIGWFVEGRVEGNEYELVLTDLGRKFLDYTLEEPIRLTFKGFNKVRVDSQTIVLAKWRNTENVALGYKEYGKGKVVIFTSDCSPSWGTPALNKHAFKKLWIKILRKIVF